MYTYEAEVLQVVDGDTLLVRIDLGFEVFKQQRLRLASIDTPDIKSKAGKDAHLFVLNELAAAASLVIKTDKVDIYGRYVGHLFYTYAPATAENVLAKGHYLNQRLLDEKHATILRM